MKKVGIIRCQQTEDLCGGTTCSKVAETGKIAFQETDKYTFASKSLVKRR